MKIGLIASSFLIISISLNGIAQNESHDKQERDYSKIWSCLVDIRAIGSRNDDHLVKFPGVLIEDGIVQINKDDSVTIIRASGKIDIQKKIV